MVAKTYYTYLDTCTFCDKIVIRSDLEDCKDFTCFYTLPFYIDKYNFCFYYKNKILGKKLFWYQEKINLGFLNPKIWDINGNKSLENVVYDSNFFLQESSNIQVVDVFYKVFVM